MHELLKEVFFAELGAPSCLEDAALLKLGPNLAFTTDAFVVSPVCFKGGDIGKLAVAGTVNDLAVMGARPYYLATSFILEEGLQIELLKRIVQSMARESKESGVQVVAGDTKVVPKGQADKIFIVTTGIGEVIYPGLSASRIKPGDAILATGTLGDHGAAILAERGELGLEADIQSDAAGIFGLLKPLFSAGLELHALRDPTRGGVAAALNEWAKASSVAIELDDAAIPLATAVLGLCELLGLEPLELASEGKAIIALPQKEAYVALKLLKSYPLGKDAAQIGRALTLTTPQVLIRTDFGSTRLLEPPYGELLPRIC
jgi:hydrogenase expression/formation protein HypE